MLWSSNSEVRTYLILGNTLNGIDKYFFLKAKCVGTCIVHSLHITYIIMSVNFLSCMTNIAGMHVIMCDEKLVVKHNVQNSSKLLKNFIYATDTEKMTVVILQAKPVMS